MYTMCPGVIMRCTPDMIMRCKLNICHYNICSLTNKLDEIKLLLSSFSNQRKDRPNLILGIAETFLNDSWSDVSLAVERFTLFRADRLANRRGGLLMYVPAHLPK